jgi:uncharacterized surface protein with fasciclin (FAS1) repeats
MKKIMLILLAFGLVTACKNSGGSSESNDASGEYKSGQSAVQDDVSQQDVVKVAAGSPDHTTLVAAVKAADYVDVLSNVGPFTVFAPTNAAFDALPAGTVDNLLKKEKLASLQDVLEYHVYVGGIRTEMMYDGMTLSQANGKTIRITEKNGAYYVNNNAKILGSVQASNGVVHVIDAVLLADQ